MEFIGLAVAPNVAPSGTLAPIFQNTRNFDYYTSGWSLGSIPLLFYSLATPMGIYPYGPNSYMIDDWNLTNHAIMEYPNATTPAQAKAEALIIQDIEVRNAMFVPLYASRSYVGYKTGTLGAIDTRGYGMSSNLDLNFMNIKAAGFQPGPPQVNNVTKYGVLNPPEMINPVFSSWLWDYTVVDRIFTTGIQISPYNPTSLGKSPAGRELPWMAYDWKLEFYNSTGNYPTYTPNTGQNANVTYWFRHDITWHDGVPFTVADFNYTIFLGAKYGDSWSWSDMIHAVDPVTLAPRLTAWDSYTCSVLFDFPSVFAVSTPMYDMVPMHIYKYIAIPAGAEGGTSTSGHHGYWPGDAAIASEISVSQPDNPNPFTNTTLHDGDGGRFTWIGTNMWKYRPGSHVPDLGGGITLDAYPSFWMRLRQGELVFRYVWNSPTPPSSGQYTIGLTDLVMLAQAYGTNGTGWPVPFALGGTGVWESGCDLAPPVGVGLTDLVTLAQAYQQTWGNNP